MSNQYLTFDVTKSNKKQQLIIGRQGDSQLKFVSILFWDGEKNVPYDLTGKQVVFEALKPDNTHIVDYEGITILNAKGGLARYAFNEQVFAAAGTMHQAFFKITQTDSNNNVITDSTLEISIKVLENRVEFGINSEDYLSEYDRLVAEVKKKFDDYAATVQYSLDKAQEIHDQIIEYTNLINSSGVIKRAEFGEVSSIKQPAGTTVVDKLNNEFADRGVNVKWFGTKADGVTDDASAFNSAISQARSNFINSTSSNVVIVPRGVYMIKSAILLPPYIKLVADGNVKLITDIDGINLINIGYYKGDDTQPAIVSYIKQGYSKGKIINGDTGGISLEYVGNLKPENSTVTGIKIGVDEDSSPDIQNWYARFSLSEVFVTNFHYGMLFSKWNTFIISGYGIHLELNDSNVVYGQGETTTVGTRSSNSGENISFYGSVFAGGANGFLVNCTYFDTNLYGCSVDFNKNAFNFKRGMATISMFGGHVESNSKLATAEQLSGDDKWYGFAPVVNISGTQFFMGLAHEELFVSGKTHKIVVNLRDIRLGDAAGEKALYLADDNTVVHAENIFSRSSYITPISKKLNPVLNAEYADETMFRLTSSNVGESWSYTTNNIPPSQYNKVIQLTGGSNTSNWGQVQTVQYSLNNAKQIAWKIPNYHEGANSFTNMAVEISFYDDTGLISKSVGDVAGSSSAESNTWVYRYGFIDGIPINAKKFDARIVIGGAQQGKRKLIGPLAFNIF